MTSVNAAVAVANEFGLFSTASQHGFGWHDELPVWGRVTCVDASEDDMSYLTGWRLGMGVFLSALVGLALLQIDLLIQLAFAVGGAGVMTVLLWPRAPWWGDRATAVLADPAFVRREGRRGLIAFGVFLAGAVGVGLVYGYLS